jgi:hypothetical protein
MCVSLARSLPRQVAVKPNLIPHKKVIAVIR